MSLPKIIFALLAIAIILLVFFNINLFDNQIFILILAGLIIIFLFLAFFDVFADLINILISFIAFLFVLYILMILLRLLSL